MLDAARQPMWLGGFHFESSWEPGAPIALVGTLNGRPYREAGSLLVFEPERRLSYSHWSKLWRVPDDPTHRALLTLTLEAGESGSVLTLHHDLPAAEALAQHSSFFWRGGLEQVRRLAEG